MTESPSAPEAVSRRQPVQFDRVTCWRLGPGVVDRCRECVYLLRLEGATAPDSAVAHVVCAGDDAMPEDDFAW